MKNIVLCCAAGMSTSMLVQKDERCRPEKRCRRHYQSGPGG
ncbi:hypothetical protein OGV29_02195 [Citrobacter sp. Cb013]|nr:hypothetical protein [Citrobacter sp. Cb013]MDM3387602.1 hypothetical protein [Citrobacter sp. Cb013]